jgi:hypothetical protein
MLKRPLKIKIPIQHLIYTKYDIINPQFVLGGLLLWQSL